MALHFMFILIVLLNRSFGYEQFSTSDFPNPQGKAEDHWKCQMNRPAYLCDPDMLLNHSERAELGKLVDHFKEWTKMPNSDDLCARQGVQLGIALSHYYILSHKSLGIPHRSKSGSGLFASYDSNLNAREENVDLIIENIYKYEACESIALKWGLRKGNCSRYVLIQLSNSAYRNMICSNVSVPILIEEKLNILAAEKNRLFSSHAQFLPALKAIIGNLRQLIVHRQEMLIGEQALGSGSTTTTSTPATTPTTTTVAQTTTKPRAITAASKTMTENHPILPVAQSQSRQASLPPFFWFSQLFSVLLSLAAFLLALLVFINQKQALLNGPLMQMSSLKEKDRANENNLGLI